MSKTNNTVREEEKILKQLDDIRESDIPRGYLKKQLSVSVLDEALAQARQEVLEEVKAYLYNLDSVPWEEQVDEFIEQLKNKS